jgi:hypothetical protein
MRLSHRRWRELRNDSTSYLSVYLMKKGTLWLSSCSCPLIPHHTMRIACCRPFLLSFLVWLLIAAVALVSAGYAPKDTPNLPEHVSNRFSGNVIFRGCLYGYLLTRRMLRSVFGKMPLWSPKILLLFVDVKWHCPRCWIVPCC